MERKGLPKICYRVKAKEEAAKVTSRNGCGTSMKALISRLRAQPLLAAKSISPTYEVLQTKYVRSLLTMTRTNLPQNVLAVE